MIKSMTGYGKGRLVSRVGTITVEMRSLNHKYFDIVSRLPNHLSIFDDKVRDYVKKKIRRGRINLFVTWESKEKAQSLFSLDLHLARRYHHELLKLKRELKLKDDLGLSQIISLPEVITYEQKKEKTAQLWPFLKKAIERALYKLDQMRQAEGKRLLRDLLKRLRRIRYYLGNIESQLPKAIEKYRKELFRKLRSFSGIKKPNHDRVAEEVALFVRNSDVSEEVTRIKSHLKAFRTALRNQKEAGKELDFIAQELFREANTIGAKASDFRISRWVIKIKSQIEKMREQLQNVE
ncbi:MAG: YicC family protein [Candidatus Omnitrophota bacterium]|nr:MAG: YicC family protein [Candidatus Omnitrophota bacterium]